MQSDDRGPLREAREAPRATVDKVAAYALANQAKFKIEYVIYRQRIDFGGGWEAMEDRGSITQNHFDHVHVSFNP